MRSVRNMSGLAFLTLVSGFLSRGVQAEDVPPTEVESLKRRLEAAEAEIAALKAHLSDRPRSTHLYTGAALDGVAGGQVTVSGSSVDTELAARVAELETKWKAQADADAKKAAAGPSYPTVKVIGRVHADAVWANQDERNIAAVGADIDDGANMRRARIGAEGLLFDVSDYRIEVDFAGSGRPSFNDVYTTFRELPLLGSIRVGHMKEPFSLEQLTSANYMMFMERTAADAALVPGRNLGVMTFNRLEDESLTWTIGGFRTSSDEFGDDVGDEGEQAATARLTWNPYYDEGSGGRYLFHVGGAYSFRDADEGVATFAAPPEVRMRTSSTAIGGSGEGSLPNFVSTGAIPTDDFQLFGAEAALVWGSLSVQSEYIAALVDQTAGGHAAFEGGYVQASYFLTGEHRVYNRAYGTFDRVLPLENFFRVTTEDGCVCTGWGAWELKARWSYLDLNDSGINGGRLNDLTFGINWYVNANARLMLDYVRAGLDKASGAGAGDSNADFVAMRAMFFW